MGIESIKYKKLRDAVIGMQTDSKMNYYGFFMLYFKFIEDEKIPAAGGVRMKNRRFEFIYNPKMIEEYTKKFGDDFMKFLIIHECDHILLNHLARTEERNPQLANIAQDMLINSLIKKEYGFDYADFFYVDRKYDQPIVFDPAKFNDPLVFEFVYNAIFDQQEQNQQNGSGKGGQDSDKEPNDCEDDANSGKDSKNGKSGKSSSNASKSGKGELVDYHDENSEEMTDQERAMIDSIVREIHDSLKARGYACSEGIENIFNIKKKKTKINVFRKIFNNGTIKEPSYRKLSRKHSLMKGKRKDNKDINLVLDTSGSLYNELDQYMGHLIGNHTVYVVQIDTAIKFAGKISSISQWKKLQKTGGGGTTLQPAIDKLVEIKRGNIPTVFISDFYCDHLDLSALKGHMTFVKTQDATDPQYSGSSNVKVVASDKS